MLADRAFASVQGTITSKPNKARVEFIGTHFELEALAYATSGHVEVRHQGPGKLRIDLDNGVVLTWYSSTKTLQFQGPRLAVVAFKARFLKLASQLAIEQ
jgi:hypothetical protein